MFSGALITFIGSHDSFSWLKKYVFNDFLKIATDGDFLISGGIAFQSKSPAKWKKPGHQKLQSYFEGNPGGSEMMIVVHALAYRVSLVQ